MLESELRELLEAVRSGDVQLDVAMEKLRDLPFADIGVARVDHHRQLRLGFPEVILCDGKTPDEVARIAAQIATRGTAVLGTRCSPDAFARVRAQLPRAAYNERGRTFRVAVDRAAADGPQRIPGRVALITAGTSDLAVAEEAAETLSAFGVEFERLYDVGVAGLHRLLASRDVLSRSDILVVIAGMEGALASVVAGMAGRPTIAVPTSVGYGASFGGLAALLGMLNSCAVGVTVVNIDNGFGAAAAATLYLRTLKGEPAPRAEGASGSGDVHPTPAQQ